MVELKHCPSHDGPADDDTSFLTRVKDHAIEFYEASPEQHRQCLRNTFNKYMSKLGTVTGLETPAKISELEVTATTGTASGAQQEQAAVAAQ